MKPKRKQMNLYKVYERHWVIAGDVGEYKTCYGNGNQCNFVAYYGLSAEEREQCDSCYELIGTTRASSETRALSNVLYRTGVRKYIRDDGRVVEENEFKVRAIQ